MIQSSETVDLESGGQIRRLMQNAFPSRFENFQNVTKSINNIKYHEEIVDLLLLTTPSNVVEVTEDIAGMCELYKHQYCSYCEAINFIWARSNG